MPKTTRYSPPAIALHWLMALGIIAMLAIGFTLDSFALPTKFQLIQFHKSLGLTILLLAVLRLTWRFTNPAPMLPPTMPTWQKAIAHASHWLLYALMFLMPLSGWVMSDFAGYHPSLFGLQIPILVEHDPASAKILAQRHGQMAWLLVALLAAHVGAALYHHFVQKDDILRRMLPATKTAAKR